MKYSILMTGLLLMLMAYQSQAENKPLPHPNDSRIKTVSFVKNDVVPIHASYKRVTHIDLGKENIIIDVIAGDTESWKIEQTSDKSGVLVKPLTYQDSTNLLVITKDRNYNMELIRSSNTNTYSYVFQYPDDEFNRKQKELERMRKNEVQTDLGLDKPSPEDWNFSYVLSGSKDTSPIQVFDDGKFMYLNFGKKPIPAIFSVDQERDESVINYHRSGNYIVIQGMYKQLTLRSGSDKGASCVFNKNFDASLVVDPSEVIANQVELSGE